MSDRIKISREFRDSILGGLWLGIERDIPEDCEDIGNEFVTADEQLKAAFNKLSYEKNNWPLEEYDGRKLDGIYSAQIPAKERRKEEVVASLMLIVEMATTKKNLELIRTRVENLHDPKLQEAYDKKMGEFV